MIEAVPEAKHKNRVVAASPASARRRPRRRFSVEEKSRILRDADACTKRGQLRELLRREGIYSSHLSLWRRQRTQLGLLGLQARRPGPKSRTDARDRMLEQLQQRVAELAEHLRVVEELLGLVQ